MPLARWGLSQPGTSQVRFDTSTSHPGWSRPGRIAVLAGVLLWVYSTASLAVSSARRGVARHALGSAVDRPVVVIVTQMPVLGVDVVPAAPALEGFASVHPSLVRRTHRAVVWSVAACAGAAARLVSGARVGRAAAGVCDGRAPRLSAGSTRHRRSTRERGAGRPVGPAGRCRGRRTARCSGSGGLGGSACRGRALRTGP